MKSIALSVACVLSLGLSVARAADPVGERVEAESCAASNSTVESAADASAGQFVRNTKAWQPVVLTDTPKTGDRLSVFVRHRGGPIQLKVLDGDSQKEKEWAWDKPADWAWSSLGTYDRADLGQRVLLMRGDDAKPVDIDAVVFAPAAATPALPPDKPDSAKPATDVDVTIDWNTTAGTFTPLAWGVNDYEVLDPKTATDAGFLKALSRAAPPLIRIHRGDFPAEWSTADGSDWDVAKIRACVTAVRPAYRAARVMMNIARWPAGMDDAQGCLDLKRLNDYAAFCGKLVRILKQDVRFSVAYWEITNELDDRYEKAGRLGEVVTIYNAVAHAIKAVDPSAKVGGPAFTWAKTAWLDAFLPTADPIDFVTYHNYGVGDPYDSNETLYSRLNDVSKNAAAIRKSVDAAHPGRRLPVFLTEYNVKWTWDPFERRHANSVGAAFQAAVVNRVTRAGIDGATVWNFKGGAYGVLDGDDKPRLTFPLFEWGPKYLVGRAAPATASSPDLEIIAVQAATGRRSLLLINKADHALSVRPPQMLLGPSVTIASVSADGVHSFTPMKPDLALRLEGYSLTLLVGPS